MWGLVGGAASFDWRSPTRDDPGVGGRDRDYAKLNEEERGTLSVRPVVVAAVLCTGVLYPRSQTATPPQIRMTGSSAYKRDPRVDGYIERLPDWQQHACQQLRDLIHGADPEVSETIKRTVQPYFVLQGNICALLAAKDHINLFLYDGGIVPDPEGIITAGQTNKTASGSSSDYPMPS